MRTYPRFNRREHERFRLSPMYTSVGVEPKPRARKMFGHAYDISESGVRVELDEALSVGDIVTVQLELPSERHGISSEACVRWVNDAQDDPGPRRMALQFTRFRSPLDQQRLRNYLGCGLLRLAA